MYTAIAKNKRMTVLIMAIFIVIIGVLGWVFSEIYHSISYLYIAVVVSLVYALIQYAAAAKIALAVNSAREIQKRDNPRLYRTVENLTIATGMPMPKVYIMDDPAPNAFATGRDPSHAVVCATTGLLSIMTDSELEAVMAHELGHVQNYDIRVMMIVFGLVSAIGLIADLLSHMLWWRGDDRENNNQALVLVGYAAAILAPLVALLVQLAVSRQREYLADGTSAMTTRHPQGLISALKKIEAHGSATKHQNTSTAHLFFANPLRRNNLANWFSTHPPIIERIARLESMGTTL
jgi:heat shock protein HtpX